MLLSEKSFFKSTGKNRHNVRLHEFTLIAHDGQEIQCFCNYTRDQIPKDKPLLIFNNGLVCGLSWWTALMSIFNKQSIPMVFYHYRGHLEKELEYPLSIDMLARDCRDIVNHIFHPQTFMICHSMGVNVGLKATLIGEKKIKGLILISGSALPPHDFLFKSNYARPMLKYLQKASKHVPLINLAVWKSLPYNPIACYLVHQLGTNPSKTPLPTIMHYLKEMSQMPPQIFWELLHSMKEENLYYQLPQLNLPVMLIGGALDLLCPMESQKSMQRKLNDCEAHYLEDASHVPQADFPELVAGLIMSFVNR